MIWLAILSLVISLFLSFSKITAGFLLATLSAIIFRIENKKEAYRFSVIIAVIIFLKILSIAVIPFIVAIVVTLIFLPVVDYFQLRFRIPRGISSFIIIIISMGIISLFVYYIANILILEKQKIFENLKNVYNYFPENVRYQIELQIKVFFENIGKYLSQIFSVFASTFTIVFYIIIGIILSFYLLSDYRGIMNLVRKRFNTSGLEYTIGILGRYIRIQLLSATIVGLLVYFLCLIFSINYANVIAIVAGFFNLIPNIGFAITVIISVIITLASSGNVLFDLFKLAIVFLIDSLVETTILTPKIMGNTFKIEPTLIIVSFTISTALLGIFGFFLAVPLAVLIKNFIFNEGQVPPRF